MSTATLPRPGDVYVWRCPNCAAEIRVRHLNDAYCAACPPSTFHMVRERYWFDVEDPEGFVKSFMPKVKLTPERREELVSEGMGILTKMRNDYRPGHGGLDPDGSRFSGYAARYLPGKLRDAWHRLEGHTLTTGEEGKREWNYPDRPFSLEAMTATDSESLDGSMGPDEPDDIHALHVEDTYHEEIAPRLGDALDRQYAEDRQTTIEVGVLLAEGHKPGPIARRLGLRPKDIALAIDRITRVAPYLTSQEETA